jgi:peptidoglycan/xylan/chitin deacetylase (PgdA/CDA1 family)
MRAILTYHSIDPSAAPTSIDESTFRRHVEWLASGAVQVVGLERLLSLPVDANAVAISFDDAFDNFAEIAWPLLRSHNLPVTLYVPTDHVSGSNVWDQADWPQTPKLQVMDWASLARLSQEGVALGAHGRTHRDLRRVGKDELEDEVAGAADRLEAETGTRPTSFAYPFGAVNRQVVEAARDVYALAVTVELRLLTDHEDPYRLPRLDAYYLRDGRWLDRWGTSGTRREVWLRARARRARRFFSKKA